MIHKRAPLCGCEAISSPNVCTKLAVQFLLSLNCQSNMLLSPEGHSQVSRPHPSRTLLKHEGKAGAVPHRQPASEQMNKNIHVHAHDGCGRSMIHSNFSHSYDTGTASNVTQGKVKWQRHLPDNSEAVMRNRRHKGWSGGVEHLLFSCLFENKDDFLVEVKTRKE